jgi:hypothetical protein
MNSATASKINWTSLVTAGFGLAIAFDYIPPAAEEHIITIATVGIPVFIMVLRTWFTGHK